jgi:flagellar biosynthesis anti-sigma factor FlgM
MVINKIGNVNNIVEPKKTKPSSGTKETKKNDSIQISSEGKKAAEIAKDAQLINQASNVRSDKVNEIKEKIANGSYDFNDSKIIEMVADRIANFLLR